MWHYQTSTPNWDQWLELIPTGAAFFTVDQGDAAQHVKQRLAAAGRPLSDVTTWLRHMGVTTFGGGTWIAAKDHAREQFRKFVDNTFLLRWMQTADHPAYLDGVCGANEFWSNSTPHDPDGGEKYLLGEEAMSHVWNTEYRGRTRTVHDDAAGRLVDVYIPDTVRYALWSGTVANLIPRRILDVAVLDAQATVYHGYAKVIRGELQADSFQQHHGLWNTMEQMWGVKPPLWLHKEGGVYENTDTGWQSDACMGPGSREEKFARYREIMRTVLRDFKSTAAFAEGRATPPALYTVGRTIPGWPLYEHEAAEIEGMTHLYAEEWKESEAMDAVKTARLLFLTREMQAELGLHPMHTLTNQEVFNKFRDAFGDGYWGVLVQAIGQEAALAMTRVRLEKYTGSPVEQMALAGDQKTRLLGVL